MKFLKKIQKKIFEKIRAFITIVTDDKPAAIFD